MKVNIGRYIHSNSIIHKLDGRVKLFGTVAFIVLILLSTTFFTSFILLSILLITFIVATKKPLKLIGMLITPLWITIFIFLINIFTNHISISDNNDLKWNNDIYWEFGGLIQISWKTIVDTLNIGLRIYSIILCMTILTLTTKPVLLTKSLEFYFMPLKWIKIPVNIFIQIITIALRFIPTLLDEAGRILKAQASRGVDFSNGNIKTKIKATIVLIVPLFVSAFAKADDLSNAMETRNYDPYGKRVDYRTWNTTIMGGFYFLALLGLIIVVILISNGTIPIPTWWSNMPTKLT